MRLFALPLLLFTSMFAYADGALRGDCNGDGRVSIMDLCLLAQVVRQADASQWHMDANHDGRLDNADISTLADILLSDTLEVDYVDLGLPSGTLWAACNLGAEASSLVLAETPGKHYAWGETLSKDNYITGTYFDASFSLVPRNTAICGTPYDAATATWGSEWQMPTRAQQEELMTLCTWTWEQDRTHAGMRVTGPNGHSIFLPADGYRHDTRQSLTREYGFYWNGSACSSNGYAQGMALCDEDTHPGMDATFLSNYSRINGRSIRPVRSK